MLWTSKAGRYLGKVNAEEEMNCLPAWQDPFNSLHTANERNEPTTFFLWLTAQLIHLLNTPLLLGFGKPSPSHGTEKAHILHCLSELPSGQHLGRDRGKPNSLCVILVVQGMAENWSVCRWTVKWRNSEYARKGEMGPILQAKYRGIDPFTQKQHQQSSSLVWIRDEEL